MDDRIDHNQRKKSAAALSIASNSFLVILKFVVGLVIGSVSIMSEAIHSGVDLLASVVAFFAVRESGKPPDAEHPYGHGKAEAISGAFEGLLIFLAVVLIAIESIRKMISGAELARVDLGLAVMGVSALVNIFVSRRLFRISKQSGSLALEADALHLSTDVWTSVGVFTGLLLIKFTGWHILDPLLALGVAAFITRAAWDIVHRSIKDLMDERVSEKEAEVIRKVLDDHSRYFIGFHELRARRSGSRREIDLHLVQCQLMSLQDAHAVCDHLEEELRKRLPDAHVTIHVEPCNEEDCPQDIEKCKIDMEHLDKHIRLKPRQT